MQRLQSADGMLLSAGPRTKVAVVLNQNARGVRPAVIEQLGRLVPARDLYVSESLDHSRTIARTLVERGYDGVLFGGGDGTFTQCISDIASEARARGENLPSVGVLRLGSGNALADALGASRPTLDGLVRDLRRARASSRARTLPLLAVDDKLAPFSGLGLDAQILDDFGAMGRMIETTQERLGWSRKVPASVQYALTVPTLSLPRFVSQPWPEVEIVNVGGPAYRIDWRSGRALIHRPIAPGEVLFRGRVALATTATIPYFGLKMKMFPYVNQVPGTFQLRVSTATAYETLRNLPAVFRGEYRSPKLHDFLCDGIEMRMAQPVPVQIGGDLQPGKRDQLRIELAEEPVRTLH